MNGFEIGIDHYNERSRYIGYLNYEDEIMVAFTQDVKQDWNPHINTEDANFEEVKIGDILVIYFLDNNGYNNYMWDNGDYIFRIYGNIDKKIIEKIIISIQKVE